MIKRLKPPKQIITCIIVFVLIALAFFVFTKENEQRIMEQNMEYIQDSTIQIAGQIDDVFSDGYDNIRVLSAFLSHSLEQPEVDINLVRELTKESGFDFIEYADKDGRDHNITGGISDARDRKYYLDGMKGNSGLEVIFLSNAMKFTNQGGTICIQIIEKSEIKRDETIYEFRVKDNGIGMSKEFQKHIFEPFERERSSTVSGVQGTGLGMAICKNIVEMMGGTISVISKKDVGTEFIVQLPMKKVFAEQAETAIMDDEEESIPTIRTSMKGQTILLVEDNELNREIAGEILSEAGFIVEQAEDGSIAIDKLLEKGPGYYKLVLMDIQMPIMDGYAATQTIRRFDNKELANIPIIAMTANAFEEDKRKAFEMGMNAHIAKPIDMKQLMDAMGSVLLRAENIVK